ncbi:MAG: hypothetical protein J6S82_06980 [Bacteroidales bacterium]|nr:hypothetical protein [Bacteroidales bacterium]
MKHHLLLFCTLLLAAASASANGDPVAVRSALTLSPTPVAMHVPEVQLADEYVTFTPRDRYMEVCVRYLLHNRSNRTFEKLPYGFPIDYFGSGPARWVDHEEGTESEREIGWRDGYVRNVCFTLNDRQLPWQCSRDSVIVSRKKILNPEAFDDNPDSAGTYSQRMIKKAYAEYGDDIYYFSNPILRRWYYTYLEIPAQSYVVLEVHYTVECNLATGLLELNNNLISYNNHYYGYLLFQYDFTPAAYWGDGHADHFMATLDASSIVLVNEDGWSRGFLRYTAGIGGLPMQKQGKLWQYETRHFDLAAAKPFTVDYRLTRQPHQSLDRLLNHRIPASAYTIEVSGADSKYPAANLSDLDPATTTVLKPGKNDSICITISFKKPTALEGMLLLNGYTKNAETYRNNARIDSLMVFGDYSTIHHEGEETISDFEKNDLLFGEKDWNKPSLNCRWHPLPKKITSQPPTSFDWQSLVDNALIIKCCFDPYYEEYCYTEIRIVITAAAKGLKYQDLCLSEIMLIGK